MNRTPFPGSPIRTPSNPFPRQPLAALVIAASLAPGLAIAQQGEDDEGALEEVLVTAQFREQSLQDTPLAITAVDDELMRMRGNDSIFQVTQQAPNVQLRPASGAFGPALNGFIRGIGQDDYNYAFEPGVGMYVDDVYFPTLTGTIFELVDLERVEILRGPQGTLAGRNTTGGSIRLVTKKPEGDGTGFAEVTYGRFDRIGFRGAADFAVTDDIAVRISGVSDTRDGYMDRIDFVCENPELGAELGLPSTGLGRNDCKMGTLGGKDYSGVRAAVRYEFSEDIEFNVSYDAYDDASEYQANTLIIAPETGNQPPYGPVFIPDDPYKTYEDFCDRENFYTGVFCVPPISQVQGSGWSWSMDWNISDSLAFRYIGAFREYEANFAAASDGSPVNIETGVNFLDHEATQHEFRFNGQVGDTIDWTAGVFWFEQDNIATNRISIGYAIPEAVDPGFVLDFMSYEYADTESLGVYVHGVWSITDRLNLTAGYRYSEDEKVQGLQRLNPGDGGQTVSPSPAFADFVDPSQPGGIGTLINIYDDDHNDYRLSLDYRFSDSIMAYGTVSTGYKVGGVNPRPFSGDQVVTFDKEEVETYELGAKFDLLDGAMRVNLAYFFMDYTDMQLSPLECPDLVPSNPCAAPRNLADSEIDGFEGELFWTVTPNFVVDASFSTISLEFTDVSPLAAIDPGLDTPENTPELKWSVGAQYDFDLGDMGVITPRIDVMYEDDKQGLVGSAALGVEDYTLVNARVRWQSADAAWEAALELQNLTDEEWYYNVFDTSNLGAAATGQLAPPMEWAIRLRRNFN